MPPPSSPRAVRTKPSSVLSLARTVRPMASVSDGCRARSSLISSVDLNIVFIAYQILGFEIRQSPLRFFVLPPSVCRHRSIQEKRGGQLFEVLTFGFILAAGQSPPR